MVKIMHSICQSNFRARLLRTYHFAVKTWLADRASPVSQSARALVVKLVNTADLKSAARYWACRFKSGRGHHSPDFIETKSIAFKPS